MKHLYVYDGNQVLHFEGELDRVGHKLTYFVPEEYAERFLCSCREGFVMCDSVWFSEPKYGEAIISIFTKKAIQVHKANNLVKIDRLKSDIATLAHLYAACLKDQ